MKLHWKYYFCTTFCMCLTVFFLFNAFLPDRLHITFLQAWQVLNPLCADLSNQSVLAHGRCSLSLVISQPSAWLFPKWPRAYLFRYSALKQGDPLCRSMPTKPQRHMNVTGGVRFLCSINFFLCTFVLFTRLYFLSKIVIDIFLCSLRKKCWRLPRGTSEWCETYMLDHFSITRIMPFQLTRRFSNISQTAFRNYISQKAPCFFP